MIFLEMSSTVKLIVLCRVDTSILAAWEHHQSCEAKTETKAAFSVAAAAAAHGLLHQNRHWLKTSPVRKKVIHWREGFILLTQCGPVLPFGPPAAMSSQCSRTKRSSQNEPERWDGGKMSACSQWLMHHENWRFTQKAAAAAVEWVKADILHFILAAVYCIMWWARAPAFWFTVSQLLKQNPHEWHQIVALYVSVNILES